MIKNYNEILTQNISVVEGILREFVKDVVTQEEKGQLTVNSIEKSACTAISKVIQMILIMAGALLSGIVLEFVDEYCSCGKKMVYTKRGALTRILSILGYIPVTRDELFCRRCHRGHGVTDKMLEIDSEHRITKGMMEVITYAAQLVPSFQRASATIKKLLKIEVSATQIQIISEKVGKKVFEKETADAKAAYAAPEKAAPQLLEKDKKDGVLYIFMDGSCVNTRVEDENGTTWKEMKLGLVFSDRDMIKRGKDSVMITKKEYVSFFGGVEEFKKLVFSAAAKAGYGKIKTTVIVGDGAHWNWNMCEEVFPDAVRILDFYHLSENTNSYAKGLHPEDEIGRRKWVDTVPEHITEDRIAEALEFIDKKKIEKLRSGIVDLYKYIENNRERIHYKDYKKKDYYIGSGPIESANKTVIQQRMKQAGMRWSVNGGQYIASLRAKHESNLWEDVIKVINEGAA